MFKLKISLLSAFIILTTQVASATSMHPCTPTVAAKPTHMVCQKGDTGFVITIETLMSKPYDMCKGNNYFESKTAKINVTKEHLVKAEITLYNGSFDYTLSAAGQSSFTSEMMGLDLTSCVTPQNGGAFSFGN
jgi:hypothetical protein